ncbi:MAG: DUF4230 domain-containing protein [Verrucomicrobia bacterium]|nr:DUF4230 domain-containing protein [Verrucomicrobiota bacterium]
MSRVRLILIVGGLTGALLIGLLAGAVFSRWIPAGPAGATVRSVAVVQEIQTLSQLVTVQYVIQQVVVEEDVKWFGENRVLLVAHGVVKAGVDLQRLQPEDVQVSGQSVRITLPPAQILDSYLDENKTQIIERSTGLLRTFDKNLETVARQHAVMDIRRAAREEGILREANERARIQLSALLLRLGFEHVEFVNP